MTSYDQNLFNPPAPVAEVTVRNPETGDSLSDVLMLIDSGADVTIIPQRCVEVLGVVVNSAEQYELAGFDGSRSLAFAVELDLIFLNKNFKGKFLLIEQDIGILGRDIINHLSILHDGPRLTWSEHK